MFECQSKNDREQTAERKVQFMALIASNCLALSRIWKVSYCRGLMTARAIAFVLTGIFVVAGCGNDSRPPVVKEPLTKSVEVEEANPGNHDDKAEDVEWEPTSVELGFMFKTARGFEGYVRQSEIAARGVLTDWDFARGKVRLESVFHGTLNQETVSFASTGGFVDAKVNDRVLILLTHRDGELKLQSSCTASGLYLHSNGKEKFFRNAFKPTP